MRDLKGAKRIVIKIGTNVLTRDHSIDKAYLAKMARQVSGLVRKGKEIIFVSSGAIGFGSMAMNMKSKPRDVKIRQALAAIGQGRLMHEYSKNFDRYGVKVGQILLTYDVISERKTFLNLRNSVRNLLKMGVVPIINENDVVSIDEIGTKFGDNDRLSAMVASKVDADLLIMLSDIDALYDKNPKKSKNARKLKIVEKITPKIERYAGKSGSLFAVGGMKSKIDAAKIAMKAGCDTVIAAGRERNVINKILEGREIGTLFLSNGKLSSKKRWILNARPKGKVSINKAAENVLTKGKASLLPIGVVGTEGQFRSGDVVWINDFAKAVIDISSRNLEKIKGLNSKEVCKIMPKKCRDEVIRKENIVMI